MTATTAVALIPAIAGVLLLSGYGLAARARAATPAQRLALAALAGLSVLLWLWSLLNYFVPLAGVTAWTTLLPAMFAVLHRPTRKVLAADILALLRHRRFKWAAVFGLGLLTLSIWPQLTQPKLVYYDGTPNHDGYLWIGGARLLQQQTYMTPGPFDRLHPWGNFSGANRGWNPLWGRAGAETFLAATASLTGVDPIKIYLSVNAALFLPWLAGVYLVVRTFHTKALTAAATVALVTLQPLFLFFQANANLPNLLGMLSGALVVVATERMIRDEADRRTWFLATALSTHALVFAYPEIAPFIAVPALLLVGRAAITRSLQLASITVGAALLGLALNPATTIRGVVGFFHSFDFARTGDEWVNIFDLLDPLARVPTFATLSIPAGLYFGSLTSFGATVVLLSAAGLAVICARDRYGVIATLAGGGLLLVYTVVTNFGYGLQKSSQFSAIFVAAAVPVAAVQLSVASRRWWFRALGVGVVTCFVTSLVFHSLDINKWSRRKAISTDWLALASYARKTMAGEAVLVDGATFRMAFFHSMWATYFLPGCDLYFAARGKFNGGYLYKEVQNETKTPLPRVTGYLVSREWADTFDANSTRLALGDTFALLEKSNRVVLLDGVSPSDGFPDNAASKVLMEIRPHSPSTLELSISSRMPNTDQATWHWKISVEGTTVAEDDVAGPGPWGIRVPLVPGKLNRIDLTANPATEPDHALPFAIRELRIVPKFE